MGYKFQFVTLASFHNLNYTTFELAKGYAERGMAAYSELQQKEFAAEKTGLHRGEASAGGRHRLFRRGVDGDFRRRVVHDGAQGLDRGGPVSLTAGDRTVREGRLAHRLRHM